MANLTTTRLQDVVISTMEERFGRVAVRPMDLGRVLAVGMMDDVEMCHYVIAADGLRRRAGAEDLRRFGPRAPRRLSHLFESTVHCCPECGRPLESRA